MQRTSSQHRVSQTLAESQICSDISLSGLPPLGATWPRAPAAGEKEREGHSIPLSGAEPQPWPASNGFIN